MYNLKNIRVKKLFRLPLYFFEKYHNTLKNLNGNPCLKGNKAIHVANLSFSDVILLKKKVINPNVSDLSDVFNIVFKIDRKKLLNMRVLDFYRKLNWVKKQIIDINKKEYSVFKKKTDAKLKEAGVEDLNVFGELNTLISLAEKFGKSPEDIEKWKYSLVFTIVYRNKLLEDINKRYSKILNRNEFS